MNRMYGNDTSKNKTKKNRIEKTNFKNKDKRAKITTSKHTTERDNINKSNKKDILENRKSKNKKSYFLIIFRLISFIIILISLYFLYNWYMENKENSNIINNVKSLISLPDSDSNENNVYSTNSNEQSNLPTENNVLDFSKLIETNTDTVAWVKVNGTDIDFPIVKTEDNSYYLKHNFYKNYNSAGWIFADFRNTFDGSDKNIIVYGHNRRDGSMFSSLTNVIDEKWYSVEENKTVALYTPAEIAHYQVFSTYKINANSFEAQTYFENNDEFMNYINNVKSLSVFDYEINVEETDEILTLYTCANNNAYRIILHAKKIK